MGPIRAFTRPSHGAAPGEFASTASPFSLAHGRFSAQHRPCCAHATPSTLTYPHPHPYRHTCALDPLRLGLTRQPSLHHQFKTYVPPGAAQTDPHSALSSPQTRGEHEGAWEGQGEPLKDEGAKEREALEEGKQKEESDTSEWRSNCKWKSDRNKWKSYNEESKCNKSGENNKWGKQEYKWKKDRDNYKWKKSKDECNWRGNKDGLAWKTAAEEQERDKWIKKDREQCKWKERKDECKCKKDKVSHLPYQIALAKTDEPSTSRVTLAFPFSDEEDDDDLEDEGRAAGESGHETWPISDIVETEDEEGEPGAPLPSSLVEDTQGAESEGIPQGSGEMKGESQGDPGKGSPPGESIISVVVEVGNSNLCEARHTVPKQEGADHVQFIKEDKRQDDSIPPSPSKDAEGRREESADEQDVAVGDGGIEGVEEQEEREKEEVRDEKKREERASPRDGIRATQRLRPRSYRQFLLTRERRSRVFLKARSYHLGRWFITHFTHPYPSKDQKDQLATRTNMTRNQVSEWFGNMRRRIREATRGMVLCWEERVRLYNTVITGKSEPLPILPEDTINTWVPPVPQDPSGLDNHEEVSISPKFKKTLIHRYLNHSLEAPVRSSSDPQLHHSSASASPPVDNLQHYKSSASETSDCAQSLPLCTSSPKGSSQALWNASFENVREGQVPTVGSRLMGRPEHLQGKLLGEEEGRVLKRYDHQQSLNYGPSNFKRQRMLEPNEDWLHRASTSRDSTSKDSTLRASTSRDSFPRVGPGVPGTGLASFAHGTSLSDARSSDDEWGGTEQCLRQPEELAAAYTLVQLQHM
nr:uncharacterized protein LOC128695651 [Cherax quadricarinatus]